MKRLGTKRTLIATMVAIAATTLIAAGFAFADNYQNMTSAQLDTEAEEELNGLQEERAEADVAEAINAPDAAEERAEADKKTAEYEALLKARDAAKQREAATSQGEGSTTPETAPIAPSEPTTPHPESTSNSPTADGMVYIFGDDRYKQENGVVYEYDDGVWEAESDKKIENGTLYEYDDGVWEDETIDDDDDFDDDDRDDD